jgi:hypothetical protein
MAFSRVGWSKSVLGAGETDAHFWQSRHRPNQGRSPGLSWNMGPLVPSSAVASPPSIASAIQLHSVGPMMGGASGGGAGVSTMLPWLGEMATDSPAPRHAPPPPPEEPWALPSVTPGPKLSLIYSGPGTGTQSPPPSSYEPDWDGLWRVSPDGLGVECTCCDMPIQVPRCQNPNCKSNRPPDSGIRLIERDPDDKDR